jgi:protein TonB
VCCSPTTSSAAALLVAALALACAGAPDAAAPAPGAPAGLAEDAATIWWGEREVDFPARPLAPIEPTYPALARERGIEGDATLLVYVRADGKVVGTKPLASDAREFSHAAAVAIRATPFGPGTRRREPVNSTVTIQVRFRLD